MKRFKSKNRYDKNLRTCFLRYNFDDDFIDVFTKIL